MQKSGRYRVVLAVGFAFVALIVLYTIADYQRGDGLSAYPETQSSREIIISAADPDISSSDTVRVNINTADVWELAGVLPGIGEVKAARIVEYREVVGGFKSVDELIEVKGIGPSLLEKIRPYCYI